MRLFQLLVAWSLGFLATGAKALTLSGSRDVLELVWVSAVPLAAALLFVVSLRIWQARHYADGSGRMRHIRLYPVPLAWALALMAAGLCISLWMAARMQVESRDDAQQRFTVRALAAERDFRDRIANLMHALYGIRGAFLASDYVSRDEFRHLVSAPELAVDYPGLRGLGYTERVKRRDLATFVARQRREGAADFTVHSDGNAPDLFIVKYLEPPDKNAGALGFDIGSEPVRREAAEQSMKRGQPMLTRRIALVQDRNASASALLMLPLYGVSPTPVTEAERVRTLRGWVVAPIVFQELLDASNLRSDPFVSFQVFDQPDMQAESLLFDSTAEPGRAPPSVNGGGGGGKYGATRSVEIFGQVYYLRFNSSPFFDAESEQNGALQVAFLGASLSVLLAMVLWLLLAGRERTMEMASRMTHELNRLALVAKRTSNAVLFAGTDMRVNWANEGYTRLSGFRMEEVTGQALAEVLQSGHNDAAVATQILQALQSGTSLRCQIRNVSKSGRMYWLDLEVQPLRDDSGQPSGFMAVQSDITPEVQARDALRREKERADNILTGTNVGTWESNLITGEGNWNERWASMMGFSRDEVVPDADTFWRTRLHPDDRVRINNGIERCISGVDEQYRIDVRVQRKDGSWMWILSSAKVMSRAPDGRVEWIGGIHTDITESKLLELHLRDTEAFLDRAGHISGVGGWQYNLATEELILSEQSRLIYGFEPGHQPTLQELFHNYPPAERERLQEAIDLAVENGTAWDMVLEFHKESGAVLWVRLFGEVEYDDSGAVRLVGAFQDVTREHNAQMEVQRSSALLRGAIDAINEAFVVYDPQDRLVFCNDKYRALYDKTADLMVPGVSFETLLRAGVQRGQYPQAVGREEVWVQERLQMHRTGNVSMEQPLDNGRWLKIVERRMADGHTVGFRVDITELKNAVAEAESASARLALEQSRLQNILDGTHVGTWEWNIETGELSLSQQWAAMLGYTLEELAPQGETTWARLAHPGDLAESSQRLQAHVRGDTPIYDAEVRMLHRRGGWVWILVRGKLTEWAEDGRPLRVSGTHMDISVRKLAEQALAETSATLQSVLDSAGSVAIVTTDLQRTIRIFNRGAENLLGYSADEAVGKMTGAAFFDENEMAAVRESLALVLGRQPTVKETFEHVATNRDNAEWTLVRKNGARFKANLLFSALRSAEGELMGHLAVVYDISKQKEYEASLREAMQLAEQSSVAKSQFLANMSHEIRTPMNAILGMLQLMRNTPLSPRQRDYADKTEGAARSLLGLLNDILDFSKVEAGKMQINPEPFRLEEMLEDLSVILSSNLGAKNVDLIFDVDPAIPPVLVGDALRLKQILINLGGNAVKFTERGEVVVRWSLLGRSHERVRMRIAISDTGIGIAPENQTRIFDGFTQAEANTTRRFGGTGLGLVISARLVGLMGSKLELQSALGQGTTFSFVLDLPVVEPDLLSADATLALTGPRTLLVDDNPTARTNSAAIMRGLGWEVLEASSGAQAIDLVRHLLDSGQQPLQALFVDDQMPDMDGWQTMRNIRRLYSDASAPAPKFVLVSGQNREALTKRTGREQELLDAVMVKPLTPSMFTQALHDANERNFVKTRSDMAAPEGPGRLAGMRILLVEDNPINQQVAFELLNGEGADVTLADNGQLGLDAVQSASRAFDVVLMDLQMPVMDGLTASRLLRQDHRWDKLPLIAMTANAMAADREACLAAGMNDHVGKPFDLNDLVSVLHRHTGWQSASATHQVQTAQPKDAAADAMQQAVWPPEIDVLAALDRMGGNRPLLQRAMQAFVKDAGALPVRVDAFVAAGSLHDARRELHAFKGLCATLGLAALSAQAALAEKLVLQPEGVPKVHESLAGLWVQLGEVVPLLKEVADRLGTGSVDAAPNRAEASAGLLPAVPNAQLLVQLNALHVALQASDMGAMEMHATLRQSVPEELADALAPLDAAMADLEFETAAGHCQALLEQWS